MIKPMQAAVLLITALILITRPHVRADVLETPAMATDRAAESLLIDIAQAGERWVAVGERGHIIFSDDLGMSWQQAKVPVSALLTAVVFPDENHGWAVGHGGVVLASSDAGATWVQKMDGNIANQMVVSEAEKAVKNLEKALENANGEQQEELEYELEDAQFALEDAIADAETGPSMPLLDLWFKDKDTGYVVGAYGLFFKTTDGGQSWENLGSRLDNADRFHLNAIQHVGNDTLVIAGEAGQIFRSLDLGDSWESITSPYDGSFFGVSSNGREGQIFLFGLRGNMFFSQDNGLTWSPIDTGAQETLMTAALGAEGSMVVVGNSGVLMLSNDFGATFQLHARDDRLAILSADFLNTGELLLVGEGGVSIVDEKTL